MRKEKMALKKSLRTGREDGTSDVLQEVHARQHCGLIIHEYFVNRETAMLSSPRRPKNSIYT